jgi:hypothetical protein
VSDKVLTADEIEKLRRETRLRIAALAEEIQERHAEIDSLKAEFGKQHEQYLRSRIAVREQRLHPVKPTPVHEGVESTFSNTTTESSRRGSHAQ